MTTQSDFEKLQEMAKGEPWLGFELAKVKGQIEGKAYINRDKIPDAYLDYCDWFVKATGLEPDNKVLSDWLETFPYWASKGLTIDDLECAKNDTDLVYRPGTLTMKAVALKAQKRANTYQPEIFHASDVQEKKYVPMPDSIRARIEAKLKQDKVGTSVHETKSIQEVIKGM